MKKTTHHPLSSSLVITQKLAATTLYTTRGRKRHWACFYLVLILFLSWSYILSRYTEPLCCVCVCLVYACGVCVYCAAGPSSSHIVGEYSRAGGQPTLKVFSLPSCRPAATPDGCLFCFILLFFLFILISISDSPTQTN